MKVICISGKAQHGKDTAAKIFAEKLEAAGYKVLLTHYADLLKWMCSNYFGWNGQKDEAGRTLLQKIGTDHVRQKYPKFWVDWVINLLKMFPDEWDYVIIPDCRFPNEVDEIYLNFDEAYHFRIYRPDFESSLTEAQKNHISETALDNHPRDELIPNYTLEQLSFAIDNILLQYYNIAI